ncbi:polysaccharide biosynthesis protein [Cognaticolwellia mytili]|uniref:polysaccharide biosynthesis protein n=1 Tax=Cognaticolwellia mytili TaxID=1888913 RepID=UPI000A1731EA|nr:nucleoside-diphosphate sugar epimerase/dehydratase [Cognaticolwellia mytili]
MVRRIDLIPSSIKLLLAIIYDLIALSIAFYLAYIIRLGVDSVQISWHENIGFITVVTSTIALFYAFDVYNSVVRFFNAKAFLKIQLLLIIASAILYLTSFAFDAFVPRSVPIVFLVLASIQIAGARTLFSFVVKEHWFDEREGVVIYGASSAGRQLYHALSQGNKYQPLAFLDEKKRYVDRTVLGLKIHPHQNIGKLIKKYGQFKVLIAIPKVDPIRLKQIVDKLEPYALELLTIPNLSDIVSGKRSIDELREVSVEELLGRKPVKPITELLSANITGKIVMVSGAGGSIGKELCRQIVINKPKELILLDVSEALLYEVHQELSEALKENNDNLIIKPLIGNVQNGRLMNQIFHKNRVQTIYHTAAYKHVPMVESNVIAGATNNVLGTHEIAQAAIDCEVETFVLISTDKAVRPTNVMGATKRLAELVLQGFAQKDHNTRFVMVRFGNVLGSSGSVVPLFKKQIKRGGPITITHPDIIRYFMTIPEAAQLVIQAGAMGTGGDVFVLDMGNPVKIVDLAYKMTHLMGLTIKDDKNPTGDIAINYSGLRPGEKLYEELLISDNAKKTKHQRILTANEHSLPWPDIDKIISTLKVAIGDEDEAKIRQLLLDAPLSYQPSPNSVKSNRANAKINSNAA